MSHRNRNRENSQKILMKIWFSLVWLFIYMYWHTYDVNYEHITSQTHQFSGLS